ncbi:hypothetical protein B0H21DRAFT_751758 [Amylocystis lapponica]|nr:hypothetical protein B0H21DRAFT_751758 [Amylocystis lapponica]
MSGALFVFPTRIPTPDVDSESPPQLSADEDSGSSTNEPGSTSTALSLLNTASRELNTGDKRPAEDLSQYAAAAGRRVRLKLDNQREAEQFSRLSSSQRQVWTAIHLLKLQEHLEAIQPADAKWNMPDTLAAKIEHYTFAVLVSPALAFYVRGSGPLKLVMGILEKHPAWGYTRQVKNDKYKADIVEQRVKTRLTDRRSNIKDLIWLSLGPAHKPPVSDGSSSKKPEPVLLNIVQLCTAVCKKHPNNTPTVSLQMCARFAFLRHMLLQLLTNAVLAGKSHRKYWDLVDDQLDIMRKNTEPGMSTLVLTQMLEDDRRIHGDPDIQEEPQDVVPSTEQVIADRAADGVFVEDEDD